MYIDSGKTKAFPFWGEFYTYDLDDSKPLTEQEQVLKRTVLQKWCDIQEASNTVAGSTAKIVYDVYVPRTGDDQISVQIGYHFESHMYGLLVKGRVIGIFPSQVGSFGENGGYLYNTGGLLIKVEAVDK